MVVRSPGDFGRARPRLKPHAPRPGLQTVATLPTKAMVESGEHSATGVGGMESKTFSNPAAVAAPANGAVGSIGTHVCPGNSAVGRTYHVFATRCKQSVCVVRAEHHPRKIAAGGHGYRARVAPDPRITLVAGDIHAGIVVGAVAGGPARWIRRGNGDGFHLGHEISVAAPVLADASVTCLPGSAGIGGPPDTSRYTRSVRGAVIPHRNNRDVGICGMRGDILDVVSGQAVSAQFPSLAAIFADHRAVISTAA